MIYDKRAELARYFGLSPNLDAAIRFLQTTDLTALPMGRTEIPAETYTTTTLPTPRLSYPRPLFLRPMNVIWTSTSSFPAANR